jgi:hypothetical protein
MAYLFPFACFSCRKSFKRPWARDVETRPCPHCGQASVRLNRKFKAPPQNDVRQWEKVKFLFDHGFRFQSIYPGDGTNAKYPETLAEAREFVKRYAHKVKRK